MACKYICQIHTIRSHTKVLLTVDDKLTVVARIQRCRINLFLAINTPRGLHLWPHRGQKYPGILEAQICLKWLASLYMIAAQTTRRQHCYNVTRSALFNLISRDLFVGIIRACLCFVALMILSI